MMSHRETPHPPYPPCWEISREFLGPEQMFETSPFVDSRSLLRSSFSRTMRTSNWHGISDFRSIVSWRSVTTSAVLENVITVSERLSVQVGVFSNYCKAKPMMDEYVVVTVIGRTGPHRRQPLCSSHIRS